MKSAYEVIEEVGRSLHTGDHALLILRKWGEEIIEECIVNLATEPTDEEYYLVERLKSLKQQL